MSPEYLHDDYLFIMKPIFPALLKKGRNIVFEHPTLGTMVKKIRQVQKDQNSLLVEGANPESISSEKIGAVAFNEVRGLTLLHIKS